MVLLQKKKHLYTVILPVSNLYNKFIIFLQQNSFIWVKNEITSWIASSQADFWKFLAHFARNVVALTIIMTAYIKTTLNIIYFALNWHMYFLKVCNIWALEITEILWKSVDSIHIYLNTSRVIWILNLKNLLVWKYKA
jgi:hypothetical protein